jgi:hypothetical protein
MGLDRERGKVENKNEPQIKPIMAFFVPVNVD